MLEHHDGSWFHFVLIVIWGSVVWWASFVEQHGQALVLTLSIVAGILHVTYLMRKHLRLGK